MKKIILFLVFSLAMYSCEGDAGPIGPTGEKGEPGAPGSGVSWHTQSFTIKSANWQLEGQPGELNSYFYADVDIQKLDDFVFNDGTVIGYISTEKNVKNGLPYVLHKGEEGEGGKEFLWTQTYDFDFVAGGIRFYVTFSDFITQKRPDDETFHIVLMW